MAASYLPWSAGHPKYAEKRHGRDGAELLSIEPWNTGTAGCEDMPRKSIDIKLTDYPVQEKKGGAAAPFSCFPARTGSGRARKQLKGRVPCRFLGQRPKPSEI